MMFIASLSVTSCWCSKPADEENTHSGDTGTPPHAADSGGREADTGASSSESGEHPDSSSHAKDTDDLRADTSVLDDTGGGFDGDLNGWWYGEMYAVMLAGGDIKSKNSCDGDTFASVDMTRSPELVGEGYCSYGPSNGWVEFTYTGTWNSDAETFTVTFADWGGLTRPSTVDFVIDEKEAAMGNYWYGLSKDVDDGCYSCSFYLAWCAELAVGECPTETYDPP